MIWKKISFITAFCFSISGLQAQDPPSKDKKDSTQKSPVESYHTLLKKAKTTDGLFKVHQVETDYYFEIPLSLH